MKPFRSAPAILRALRLPIALLPALLWAGQSIPRWPQFRGPNAQGVAENAKPPVELGPDKALLWKTTLPSGVSSPCIWGDRIFVTAFDQNRNRLETVCLDRNTGRLVWRKDAPNETIQKVHEISSPANSSPATDGERVFVHHVTYGVVAYDFSGVLAWSKPLPVSQADADFGSGASPIIADGVLLLRIQRGGTSQLLAIGCANGETRWETTEPGFGRGWATPVTWKEQGGSVVGVLSPGRFTVHDGQTGKKLWWLSGTPEQSCATPAVGDGMVFLTGTGYLGNKENIIQPPDFDELVAKYDKNQDGRIGTDELPDSLLFVNRGVSGSAGDEPLGQTLRLGSNGKDRTFDKGEWQKATMAVYQETLQDPGMKTAAFAVRTGGTGDATNNLAWSESRGSRRSPRRSSTVAVCIM